MLVNKDGAPLVGEETISLCTRSMVVEKSIDLEKRTVDFVASTDVVDSHDEIVDQGSWILDDYIANPVVLWAHQSRELPIGRSIDVSLRNAGSGVRLEHRVEFMPADLNEKADQVFRMIPTFLKAVSVGFLPKTYRWEMRNGVEVFVWADCILKEISVTPVGANPQALAKMKSMALDLRKVAKSIGKSFDGGDFASLMKLLKAGDDLGDRLNAAASKIPLRSQVRAGLQTSPAASSGHDTETPAATPQKEEKTMNLEEMLKAANEKHDKALVQIGELKLGEQKALESKAQAETKLATSEAMVTSLTTEKSALETQNLKLVEERDLALVKAKAAEDKLVEIEVESLVGKKIRVDEKETFTELRKSNPALFEKMIGQRSDLDVLTPTVITGKGEDNGVARSIDPTAPNANADIVAEAQKLGGGIVTA